MIKHVSLLAIAMTMVLIPFLTLTTGAGTESPTLNVISFASPEELLLESGYGPALAAGHDFMNSLADKYNWNLTILHSAEDVFGDNKNWIAQNVDVFIHFMTISWGAYNNEQIRRLESITTNREVGHLLLHSSLSASANDTWIRDEFIRAGSYLGRTEPKFQTGEVTITQPDHPLMQPLMEELGGDPVWNFYEEFYAFSEDVKNKPGVEVYAVMDPQSVTWVDEIPQPLPMNSEMPIIWSHRINKSTVLACVFAELEESWRDPAFKVLFESSIKHVIPKSKKLEATQPQQSDSGRDDGSGTLPQDTSVGGTSTICSDARSLMILILVLVTVVLLA